ncbi:MAG: sigma-70 family RNA polymerase sigma factor [Polyangiaceae bacterium]|nr:sigma-70 family RNA polymerase sigma factor [Polyangiaceae bacterium]
MQQPSSPTHSPLARPPQGELRPLEFDAVYTEFFGFVFRNARRLGVDASAVDDVVQDVFVVIFRRLPEFDQRGDGAALRSWVYGILANTVREHRRRYRRKDAPLVSTSADSSSAFPATPAQSPTPEEGAERREDVDLLLSLLAELSEEKRELLVLADLEQMSVPEICACVGGNVNTVYSRLRVARDELRGKLERVLLTRKREELA